MKSQLIIASVIVCFAFSSCKKCLTCSKPIQSTEGTTNKICSDNSSLYDIAKSGQLRDENNVAIKCN